MATNNRRYAQHKEKLMRLFTAVLSFVAMATIADAQQGPPCGPQAKVIEHLQKQYSESPVMAGVSEDGKSMFTMFANPESGTRSVVITSSAGVACLVISGEGYSSSDYKPPKGNDS